MIKNLLVLDYYLGFYYNYIKNYGKEVIILKSSISHALYQEFVSNYQTCNSQNSPDTTSPFVYVDTDGAIKFVTDVVDSFGGENEIFALSVANDGFVEFLAFQDT